jgi:hypothetical protein
MTWGGSQVPSKTPADARSRGGGWRLCRRQERCAAVSGTEQQENQQDGRLDNLEQQAPVVPDPPAREAPAAALSMPDQLNQLATVHAQGALTDDEFAAAKAKLLSG